MPAGRMVGCGGAGSGAPTAVSARKGLSRTNSEPGGLSCHHGATLPLSRTLGTRWVVEVVTILTSHPGRAEKAVAVWPRLELGLLAPAGLTEAVVVEAGLQEERLILPQTGLARVGGSLAEGRERWQEMPVGQS